MEEQVKLFVDLFNEEERTKQIGRLKKRIPIWKWIVRVLVISLLLWAGAVIFFDFEWDGFDELGQRKFKVTSPYFKLSNFKPSKNFLADHYNPPYKGYLDFDSDRERRKYFEFEEAREARAYKDFDETNTIDLIDLIKLAQANGLDIENKKEIHLDEVLEWAYKPLHGNERLY
jgi:hypothetical protein